MLTADRLRRLPLQKMLSQGDIEKRTGLLRCYISRIENGHTVPRIETLEKMAHGLKVPIYELFYGDDGSPKLAKANSTNDTLWSGKGRQARWLIKFRCILGQAEENDRKVLMALAQNMANRPGRFGPIAHSASRTRSENRLRKLA
jgi:transcriptional regulator with XRE-family HTH domain